MVNVALLHFNIVTRNNGALYIHVLPLHALNVQRNIDGKT